MKLKIIYNNEANPGFKPGWGFACLIENKNEKILFDTGADSETLLYNMEKLKIEPKEIKIIVISHNHWDHVGGLQGFLKANENKAKIIKPAEFSKPTKIIDDIYSTGYLQTGLVGIKEQSLFIKTKKGLVVLVGCSHPGVDKILDVVKKYRQMHNLGKIYAVIGGFHGFDKFDYLKGINIIGACHCTQYKKEIKEKYPKNYKEIRAGDIIEV